MATRCTRATDLLLFGFGSWFAWKKYGSEVRAHSSYKLGPESIVFNDPPDWLHRDILAEVVELGSLESRNSTEADVSLQVRNAFMLHPWVKDVDRVRVFYPAKLEAVVVYRHPVAMVALPPSYDPSGKPLYGMIAIDEEGTLLPKEDFHNRLDFAESFPRIDVGNTLPTVSSATNGVTISWLMPPGWLLC